MKKILCIFALCYSVLLNAQSILPENTSGTKIEFIPLLNTQFDNTGSHQPFPRNPVDIPDVFLDDHTLYIYTVFGESIGLQLLDPDTMDDDEPTVVYSTVVPAGVQQVALPSTFTGEYGIRLVVGNWFFIGYISL